MSGGGGIGYLRALFNCGTPRPKRPPNPPRKGLTVWFVCATGLPAVEVVAATRSEARARAKAAWEGAARVPPGTWVLPVRRAAA